ncbi:MAG TPA: flagellar biosynthesis protein FlhF [Woeseiaceae bacterium]|nr:flagellar biosynthesis protein FlhF [Woeseiaceae bacterium]
MKIKRYIEKDMRQALRAVREEQGPDAVILSTRRVADGIEVIAAIDYDEALVRQALGPSAAAPAPGTKRTGDAADDGPDARGEPHETARAQAVAAREEPESAPRHDRPAAPPAADPDACELAALRAELTSLRSLLETQVSGLLWKSTVRRSPLRAQILRNLALLGLAPDVARRVVDSLEPVGNVRQLWRDPLAKLAQAIPVAADELLSAGGTAALVGPTGVGKTTTIAKLAANWVMRHGAQGVALVCADAWRIGAREHLEAFARIIGVEVHAASEPDELESVLDRLRSRRLVLIDTEGLSQRDAGLAERLAACRREAGRVRFYLTLAATSQEAGLDETVRRFGTLPLAGAVITRIDEAAQLGCVLGTLIRHDLPAVWLSDGQRIPDDLHPAERRRLWLVDRAVECLDSGAARIDERTMAEHYGQASVAHA